MLPTSPYTPRVKLSLLAGLFGGLILGICAAFAYQALDPRLRREEELRELFRIPILAEIPRERSAARAAGGRYFRPSCRSARSRATERSDDADGSGRRPVRART